MTTSSPIPEPVRPAHPPVAGSSPGDASCRILTVRYIAALSAVALLAIVGQFLVQFTLRQQTDASTVVNLAGRQRMLSQRLSKAALAYTSTSRAEQRRAYRDELADSLAAWQRAHEGLQKGHADLGLPGANSDAVRRMFDELEPTFRQMVAAVRAVLNDTADDRTPSPATQRTAAVEKLLALEPEFLAAMDRIVFQYDRESRDRIARLRDIERALLIALLAVLVAEGFLIFRPAVRRIASTLTSLRHTSQALQRAKDQAEESNRAKDRFLAGVSHELRTPLHATLGLTDLLLRGELDDQQRQRLTAIADSSRTLLCLVDDLLDLARIEANRLDVSPQPVAIGELLDRLVVLMQPEANARQLQLACNRDARIPRVVMVDPVRLRQVLTNLLGNALKFTDTGRVTLDAEVVALTDRRARLRFAVADTGIGISIDDQARIFERFVQARQAPNRPRGGVGLGLAISARLVSIMGGSLQVESKLGQGSRFWFELDVPVADTSASESTSDSLTTMPAGIRGSHSLRVLVAEDTPASQLLIRDLLSEAGHTVDLASDGAAALDAFRHSAFDLVLMDVQMPRLDGLETTRAMRAHERQRGLPATPIVALTAYALPQHRDECLAAGMTGYLTKPIMASDLFASLHRYRCAAPTPSSASETSSRMDGLEVRWQPSIARLQGRVALFKRLARSFIDHGPMALESLHNAAATHDAAAVRVAAHQLKGQAAMFDAADLCAAARQLEEAATSGHLTNVALVLADVERHHASLIDELRELISA